MGRKKPSFCLSLRRTPEGDTAALPLRYYQSLNPPVGIAWWLSVKLTKLLVYVIILSIICCVTYNMIIKPNALSWFMFAQHCTLRRAVSQEQISVAAIKRVCFLLYSWQIAISSLWTTSNHKTAYANRCDKPTNKQKIDRKRNRIYRKCFLWTMQMNAKQMYKNLDWTFWNADCIMLRLFQTIAWGGWFGFFISKECIIRSVCRETHAFCWCLLTSIYISWFIYQKLININVSGQSDTKIHFFRFCTDVRKT